MKLQWNGGWDQQFYWDEMRQGYEKDKIADSQISQKVLL